MSDTLAVRPTWSPPSGIAAPVLLALYEADQSAAAVAASSPLLLRHAVQLGSARDQSLLFVPPPAASITHPSRTLHLRLFQTRASKSADEIHMDDEEEGEAKFDLLASGVLLASELARVANTDNQLRVPLVFPTSQQNPDRAGCALMLQARVATAVDSSEAQSEARANELAESPLFEGLPRRVQPDGQTPNSHVLTAEQSAQSHQSRSHPRSPNDPPQQQMLVPCTLSVSRLPSDAVTPFDEEQDESTDGSANGQSVYLAALYERDTHTGRMKLQGVTPWTRPVKSAEPTATSTVHFPGRIAVDYLSREKQVFQLSLYRFRPHQLRLAQGGSGSSSSGSANAPGFMPSTLSAQLREEERVGSAEFFLDYLGLESEQISSGNHEGSLPVPAAVGRLHEPSESRVPGRVALDVFLSHDLSARQNETLKSSGSVATISVNTAALARARARGQAGAAGADIARSNQTQMARAMQLASSITSTFPAAGGSDEAAAAGEVDARVEDAEDVDVTGMDISGSSVNPDLNARLLRMLTDGQTFLVYSEGQSQPRARRLFYRVVAANPEEPGVIYSCDPRQRPAEVDLDSLEPPLDLCACSDIFLGRQAAVFFGGDASAAAQAQAAAASASPSGTADADDGRSFSLVVDGDVGSLHLEALTPQRRSAWILAIMTVLGQGTEEQQQQQQSEELEAPLP